VVQAEGGGGGGGVVAMVGSRLCMDLVDLYLSRGLVDRCLVVASAAEGAFWQREFLNSIKIGDSEV